VIFQQAVIRLKPDGEYYVVNEGRRPIFIDGKPVLTDVKAKLHHNSTFEVRCPHLRYVVHICVMIVHIQSRFSKTSAMQISKVIFSSFSLLSSLL
jgi:hypothetical protein